jgi:hypothetical protein
MLRDGVCQSPKTHSCGTDLGHFVTVSLGLARVGQGFCLTTLSIIDVRDVQHVAARLAVDGVRKATGFRDCRLEARRVVQAEMM